MISRHLLDTHAFLWLSTEPERVPCATRDALAEADVVVLSAASAWEISIKHSLGKLPLPRAPHSWLSATRRTMDVVAPAFTERHALGVARLPTLHGDPFDRALVAVALADGLTLVSRDRRLADYGVDTVW